MNNLEQVALAIFRKVTSDPDASWDTMSVEERDDALEWARAGLETLEALMEGDEHGS